jgi:hypothetical protein
MANWIGLQRSRRQSFGKPVYHVQSHASSFSSLHVNTHLPQHSIALTIDRAGQ